MDPAPIEAPAFRFADLPKQCLEHILSFLDNEDRVFLSLSCKPVHTITIIPTKQIPPSEGSPSPITGIKPKSEKKFLTESYALQSKTIWPGKGQHIMAQFDEDSIIVYQAYKKDIADYAVKHQKFSGCPSFGEVRMTWVKTNFLWMMFRSGWGSKHNQDHVLAIWLKLSAFETYLENAREKGSVRDFKGTVRLQWDPDHDHRGDPHIARRAVQLGLKNVTSFVNGTDIVCIQDVSEFVHAQGPIAKRKNGDKEVIVARERVFTPKSEIARKAMNLSKPT